MFVVINIGILQHLQLTIMYLLISYIHNVLRLIDHGQSEPVLEDMMKFISGVPAFRSVTKFMLFAI